MRAPTSLDVARLAGVSQPTVSRALRGDPRVIEATRERVREAATQLGYVPSRRGRSLSTRATDQIAVLVTDLGNPFYTEAVEHLHAALEQHGQRVVVLTDRAGDAGWDARLLDGSVDGVVLTNQRLRSPLPAQLAERGLPCVMFNRAVDGTSGDVCVSRNAAGAAAVARELVGLGHRRVGAIFGPRDTSTGRDRERGFRAALTKAGQPIDEELVRRGPFTFATGRENLQSLLAGPTAPTAVFCGNDVVAIGALNAAAAAGVAVPTEVSIFGFDDIGMAQWDVFELSTVRQDLAVMAQAAAQMLLARIAEPTLPPRRIVTDTRLVLRSSHGPPSVR
jgi:LacI family transcriptional regulator